MRTNEYYSKKRIALAITGAVTIYSILTTMSVMTVRAATAKDHLAFTPNFDKGYKSLVALDNVVESSKDDTKSNYSLSNISYDSSTLYLDWSEIEAERAKIEKARKEEEALKKAQEVKAEAARKAAEVKSVPTIITTARDTNNNSSTSTSTNVSTGPSTVTTTKLKTMGDSLSLPDILDTSFKGYMCMHKVTSTSSKQWKFLHSGEFDLTTDNNGIMMYDGYYIVAMASYYTNYKVGSTFRITLDSGVVFDVITGDEKADRDTDNTHTFRPKGIDRGEIIEFIVACGEEGQNCNEYHTMSAEDRRLGDLSSLGFQGNVVKIEKLNDTSVTDKLY